MNFLFIAIVLCSAALPDAEAKWHIDAHTSDQDVHEGDEITLMCRSAKTILDVTSNANWKTCLWQREHDSSYCLMEYKCKENCHSIIHSAVWEVTTTCEPGLKDVTYFGSDPNVENHICGIVVPRASPVDNSTWTCDVSYNFFFHFLKTHLLNVFIIFIFFQSCKNVPHWVAAR